MTKMRLETTSPFQGLAELVADDEGLFAEEGIEIEWVKRANTPREVDPKITTPDGLSAFGSHGEAFEKGGADMYNACEWGNYRRVQDTEAGAASLAGGRSWCGQVSSSHRTRMPIRRSSWPTSKSRCRIILERIT